MERYAVALAPSAIDQLDRLFAFIAEQSGEARAEKYVDDIVSSCLSLSIFPERGTKREEIRSGLRTFGHKRTATIAFSIDHGRRAVTILGVFYGGQNFEEAIDG